MNWSSKYFLTIQSWEFISLDMMNKKVVGIGFSILFLMIIPFHLAWGLTTVKVGLLRLFGTAPIFIGMDKGFFESEGIRVEPIWFKAAQPVAVATATGDPSKIRPRKH